MKQFTRFLKTRQDVRLTHVYFMFNSSHLFSEEMHLQNLFFHFYLNLFFPTCINLHDFTQK